MTRIRLSIALLLFAGVLSSVMIAGQVKVVPVPTRQTDMSSGPEMYREYCAVCHGPNGHGSAKAAAALKTTIPDLTTIGKRNSKRDVADFVEMVLRDDSLPGHQAKGMPDWRPILFRLSGAKEDAAMLRRANLGKYVASMQGK
jgi:mono/diheme cytochrome c family protein